jgi:nucleoporin POM34
MSSTQALALNKTRTSGALTTPSKPTPAPAAESPGNWQHPRMKEITRRQQATTFGSDNVKTIIYNLAALVIIHLVRLAAAGYGVPPL